MIKYNSKTISLISPALFGLFVSLAWFSFPANAQAKTLQFQDKSWDIDLKILSPAKTVSIRNNASLLELARAELLGMPLENYAMQLGDENLNAFNQIVSQTNRSSTPAKMQVEAGRATLFEPGQDGLSVDVFALYQILASADDTLPLPVIVSRPKTTLAETNNLGIIELVARGESDFSGSPKNRIVNIKVGAKKFDGLIVPANEEFSFNKYLGDVDEANGFLPELVIKKTGVVPELGGGLCQVSSTTFRAAMNAGMPIKERRNHSFPVHYYSPQGTDATIYPGVSDLRFVNNLTSNLLIHTRIEGTKLFFDFYGTKDDRRVAFDGPYQYDKKPDGSMKAVWTRKVTLGSDVTEQTFRSNYLSPDLFKKITTVESNIPNPETPPPAPAPAPTQTN
ncbi:MAG TPA: VanW family protein [Patescibacteria group bacterium]|jgi:vancomycin resistance protein YoaR|nr:VanW family protein [Patescibacteria group bacterium]